MNRSIPWRVLAAMPGRATAFALLLAAACGPPAGYQQATRNAADAERRGDIVAAIAHHDTACQLGGAKDPSCARAQVLRRHAYETSLTNGRAACAPSQTPASAARQAQACADALAPAATLYPGDPELARLRDVGGRHYVLACAAEPPADVAAAIEQLACGLRRPDGLDSPDLRARLGRLADVAAESLLSLAAQREIRQQPAALAAVTGAAACLDPSIGGEADRAARALRDHSAVAVRIDAPGYDGVRLCERTVSDAAVCTAPRSGQETLVLRAHAEVGRAQHEVSEIPREQSFQAGIDRYPNPAYAAAERLLDNAQHTAQLSEREAERAKLECEVAYREQQRANCVTCPEYDEAVLRCEHADTVAARHRDDLAELDDARAEFASTPAILEEPRYETFAYRVRQHRWSAPASVIVEGGGRRLEQTDDLVYTDEEHPGSGRAGVAENPLTRPAAGWLDTGISDRLIAVTRESIHRALLQFAEDRRAGCPSATPTWDGPWLSCWAESRLWAGQAVGGDVLLNVASAGALRGCR